MIVNIDDLVQTMVALSLFSGGFYHLILKPLEKTTYELHKCLYKLQDLLKGIELEQADIKAQIRILENSVKAAHRRMDEHKVPRAESE